MKVYGKTMKKEKIKTTGQVEAENLNTFSGITKAFMDLAEKMGIPTPVITRTNAQYFFDFNSVKFKKDDFVEKVDFDFWIVEKY